ncbi:MAG: excinuclease ABC subunit A, partial [Bacteroidales bacterium]|nr:excinuclease ABC subunit A [Bacteroidales bacterium]
MDKEGSIIIKGARVNNLKNITVEIPRGKFVVVTGISGSGKSSLAFDTLFAEGQRRFAQSLSSYARQFLGRMSKPDVDIIEGIPPAIAIEQKVNVRNPRSTVATTTEIYDYLRLLYARVGHTFSPVSGREVKCDTVSDVISYILGGGEGTVFILADIGWDDRDDKVELMLSLKEQGFSRFYGDGPVRIEEVMKLAETGSFPKGLRLLIDRARIPAEASKMEMEDLRTRLLSSISSAFSKGDGSLRVLREDTGEERLFVSKMEMDGITFRQPDEYLFSFNSPLGACPECGGLGKIIGISEDLIIPDKTKSIYDGAIACWRGEKMGWFRDILVSSSEKNGIRIFEPWCNLTQEEKDLIWKTRMSENDPSSFVGLDEFFEWVKVNRYKIQYKFMLNRFSGRTVCPHCHGTRLRKEALYVKVGGKDIGELLDMTVEQLISFFKGLELSEYDMDIAGKAIQEIVYRLESLSDVGLSYLTLSRNCNTLSGGESQRVNLVTALGSSLVGSMYILDEPSIGLHSRDTDQLIAVLKSLRDLGNTVIVVEHDEEIMRAADCIIDIGPGAGRLGGEVVMELINDGHGIDNN